MFWGRGGDEGRANIVFALAAAKGPREAVEGEGGGSPSAQVQVKGGGRCAAVIAEATALPTSRPRLFCLLVHGCFSVQRMLPAKLLACNAFKWHIAGRCLPILKN